jgi:hypothetical protein
LAWFAALRSLTRRATGEAMLGGVAFLRRLAAIGAVDVPGYLRPVEADRGGTLARLESLRLDLKSLRLDLIDPKIALHKGRTLKPTGVLEPTPIAAR